VTPTEHLTAGDLALRPATLDDAAFVADVLTEARPGDPVDPVLLRYFWEHPWDDGVWRRFLVSLGGRDVGLCALNYPREWSAMPERYGRVQVELLRAARSHERLVALFAVAESWAHTAGALRASTWTWDDDAAKTAAATSRGFREERRERFWELDLVANRERLERMTTDSRHRMRERGFTVLTLADETDPDRYRKLWEMSNEAQKDVPTTVPHTTPSLDSFITSLRSPGLREDRIWIARSGGDLVGISMLEYPPVRGVVQTDWTGTARSVRGRGVARALKCETVMQAIALGVDRVRTDNDAQNAPILHLNESMGYRHAGEMVQLLKQLGPS
jgi:GNAT superfamily N-acetyltransferase